MRLFMTNFEKYISNLTQDKFIDSMILNCNGCPAYPCNDEHNTEDNGADCEKNFVNGVKLKTKFYWK